jgi:2-phospho-L-lactate guanylyltransferase
MSVFAVVPVKDLWGTKSRLKPILDPGARAGLTLYMMGRVVSALKEAGVENVCVVSPDRVVLNHARERGAEPLQQESRGLNPALEEGRRWAMDRGGSVLLVLPADLPLLDAQDVRAVLEEEGEPPSVTISPDDAHAGTNALLLRPPDALPFAFGLGSYEAHQRAARERGFDVRVLERPHLSFDLDTAEDLARLEEKEARRP